MEEEKVILLLSHCRKRHLFKGIYPIKLITLKMFLHYMYILSSREMFHNDFFFQVYQTLLTMFTPMTISCSCGLFLLTLLLPLPKQSHFYFYAMFICVDMDIHICYKYMLYIPHITEKLRYLFFLVNFIWHDMIITS